MNSDESTPEFEMVLQRLDALSELVDKGFTRLEESFGRIETILARIDSRLEGVENVTVMVQADFESLLRKLREYFPEIDSNGFPF
jgi:archaellum component FlaC